VFRIISHALNLSLNQFRSEAERVCPGPERLRSTVPQIILRRFRPGVGLFFPVLPPFEENSFPDNLLLLTTVKKKQQTLWL
jgi:hypothetical protein